MPAFATHYFYAKDIYDGLDEETKARIKLYRRFYDLGAQGPDIFFYYKPYKKNNISEYGVSLHKKQAKRFIEEAIPRIKEYDDEAALMYLLGYVSHFTLDTSFHPFINKEYTSFNEHMLFETELDRFIISDRSKIAPHKFRRYFLIDSRTKYASQLHLIYPTISGKVLDEVVYQTHFYMKKLYSPHKIKNNILSFICKVFKKDNFSNLIIKKEPKSEYNSNIEVVMKDYNDVVKQGQENIINILEYYDGNKNKLSDYFHRTFG